MPIRELSPLLINQIAAGEVIERPASVVKELAENAIDAGATQLRIELEDGGRKSITIHDNGCGIPAWELPLAIAPHATSKLKAPEDLANVATLGFRGEAMASIASISRMKITTHASKVRREENTDAIPEDLLSLQSASLSVEGGQAEHIKPANIREGTRIEVRDLFFNTPARRKFLKSAQAESGQINEAVTRLALVHPEVGFTLVSDDKKKLELASGQTDKDRVIALIGKETPEGFIEFHREDQRFRQPDLETPRSTEIEAEPVPGVPSIQVWGLAGKPELARGSGKFQHICLNGRPIRDRGLSHAIKEAYRGILPGNKYPVCAVFLTIDPRLVDVNVHPAKLEVRFRQPNQVYSLILHAMREALLGEDLTPSFSLAQGEMDSVLQTPKYEQPSTEAQGHQAQGNQTQGHQAQDIPELLYPSTTSNASQKPRPAVTTKRDFAASIPVQPSPTPVAFSEIRDALSEAAPKRTPANATPSPILQIHSSYLITEDEHGLVIIDQHALHERIMFEELYQRLFQDQKKLTSQRLLVPDTLDCDESQMAIVEQLQPLFEKIGIEAGAIGPEAIAIHAFPSLLFDRHVQPVRFLRELIEKVENGELQLPQIIKYENEPDQNLIEGALHKVLDMMSCKAAVKAGDKMSQEELQALLARKDEIERSSNCPHGRPTTLRLSLGDLEKQFERS